MISAVMAGVHRTFVVVLVLAMTGCSARDTGTPTSDSDPTPAEASPTEESPSAAPATEKPLTSTEQRDLDERLIAAAWRNDVPAARRLIREGADVNWRDDSVQSAFLIAASEGYLDLLELTLRNGATWICTTVSTARP